MANKNTRKKAQSKANVTANAQGTDQQASNWERAKRDAERRQSGQQQQRRERTGIVEYFKGVRTEMKKVIWPGRKEMGSYTALVLISCTVFALLFWAVDSGVLAALRELLGINV